jgi:CRP-like cAMP-binding protein
MSPAVAAQRAPPMNRRLIANLPASVNEAAAVLGIDSLRRVVRPGYELVSEGRPCATISLILEGVAIRYRILRDGQRQILTVLLPGDFGGATSCRFETALYTIKMLTAGVIAPVPLSRMLALFDSHPQLAARLFWRFSCESTLLAERLITVGRRPARDRVAHFLLEMLIRLRALGLADERSYRLPLTQEMIGDALGLSIPYLNRVLRELRDDGLVLIRNQTVSIARPDELSALADFEHGYLHPLSIADLASPVAAGAGEPRGAVKQLETFSA